MNKETNKTIISIVESTPMNFVASYDDKTITNLVGTGINIEDAVKNLFFKHKSSLEKNEEEKIKLFVKEHYSEALKVATEIFSKIGGEFVKFSTIMNKLELEKVDLQLRLNFLRQFNMAECDNTIGVAQKWRIIVSKEDLSKYYENQFNKFNSTATYFKELSKQILEIEEQE